MAILDKIIEKLFSGKFALLVMVGGTYCILLFCVVWLVAKNKVEAKELVGLIGGVSAILVMLWKDFCHTNGDSKVQDSTIQVTEKISTVSGPEVRK